MSDVELYLKFREELDKICAPCIVSGLCHREHIVCDGKVVGLVGGTDGYIDIVYVLPEYRRKGLARKAVLEWYKKYNSKLFGTQLHIINQNTTALGFWNSLFDLRVRGFNEIDTLYFIEGRKKK